MLRVLQGQNSLGQVGVGSSKPERKKPALLSLRAADGTAIEGKTVAKVVAGGHVTRFFFLFFFLVGLGYLPVFLALPRFGGTQGLSVL